ncbi:NAD(P)-binding protein [Calocera viscosa TUFC12733]|uniref:3-oxoacyl-[acyl-carrier-protein] reductase n=1 Tax=Calocera viscosa (strain TUFC12733) TaxID=1330018 RepID=A0A167IML4_CALVF|nr:NAD(P)-binding protein [Calocera viscosa TUFC12733]
MSAPIADSPAAKRVAIVTGAAGDLGRAIALRLASDGLDVAITDLPSQSSKLCVVAGEVREKGVRCLPLTGDVTVQADVEKLVSDTVRELGGLDVMVANVGIFQPRPLLELSVEEWDYHQRTNTLSCLLCYQAAARQMVAQGRGGRLIGGCSVAGLTGAALCSAYCASKFAIRGLTMCAAQELGAHGVTVNAYAPGFIEGTKMVHTFENEGAAMMGLTPEQWRGAADGMFPMKRLGKPEEIGAIVSYFASEAAGWTTGQVFSVNGGMHIS